MRWRRVWTGRFTCDYVVVREPSQSVADFGGRKNVRMGDAVFDKYNNALSQLITDWPANYRSKHKKFLLEMSETISKTGTISNKQAGSIDKARHHLSDVERHSDNKYSADDAMRDEDDYIDIMGFDH